MFIKKERSGKGNGRGQYEVRDAQSVVGDLLEKVIFVEILGTEIKTNVVVRKVPSNKKKTTFKYRLRKQVKDAEWLQLPWQLTTALMMPRLSSDEDKWGNGRPVLRDNLYTVRRFKMSLVEHDAKKVVMAFDHLAFQNLDNVTEIDCGERSELVKEIWAGADALPEPLRTLVKQHRDLVSSKNPLDMDSVDLVTAIQVAAYGGGGKPKSKKGFQTTDAVPTLLEMLGSTSFLDGRGEETFSPENLDEIGNAEIKKRLENRFAMRAVRTAMTETFKRDIQREYRSTCVVCGLQLPQLASGRNPGVDSAHILKWADFDLDVVPNGLCLCKLHHWAFDEGLIEIRHDGSGYTLVVPEEAAELAERNRFPEDLRFLRRFTGRIDGSRLPANPSMHPNPEYLAMCRKRRWGEDSPKAEG